MSCVKYQIVMKKTKKIKKNITKKLYKAVELVGGGPGINAATPSSFSRTTDSLRTDIWLRCNEHWVQYITVYIAGA